MTKPAVSHIDSQALERALKQRVKGEVRFDAGSRALYATDGSNYRQPPIGVVIPLDKQDVIETVATARQHGAPILSRGCGTSLAGQCCNTAVIIDMSKYMNRVLHIDAEARWARIQPGAILDELRGQAEPHHLTFAPDPATHTQNTLGGMIGNNSCGIHSVMAGRTSDNVLELEVLTYDGEIMTVGETGHAELLRRSAAAGRQGEIYRELLGLRDRYAERIRARYPDIPRRVSGYNLDDLLPERGFHVARALVGSESTCVVVLEAKVQLVHSPPARVTVVLGYPDVYRAGDHVAEVMRHDPVGCEGIDDALIEDIRKKNLHVEDLEYLPAGGGWLLVEFGGDTEKQARQPAEAMMEGLSRAEEPPDMHLYGMQEARHVWRIRESGLGATAHVPDQDDTWPGWEDSAVAPEQVGPYLRELRALLDRYGYECDLYGHFGQGCIHTRIDFKLDTDEGIQQYRAFLHDAADLVVSYGGSFSGEHGDGQARGELQSKLYGEELVQGFREFKAIWDPDGKMNPGKVVDAYRIDENLRLGADYSHPTPETHFRYREDDGSFGKATLRCVGVGKCRALDGQTMCPSFMVLREERHTTRGRARLLFEMLNGTILQGGWQDEAVHESLDLCLSCKGCKSDCPVNVDMATYKAEFMAHYYEKRRRPLSAYAFALIDRWSRVAARMPGLTNALSQRAPFSPLLKSLLRVPPERAFPRYAAEPFRRWFEKRPDSAREGPPVLLWPDTFNNYFYPQTARAAVRVLEAAGFQVRLPAKPLCCGRPLYEFGMLDLAKSRLKRIMETLQPLLEQEVPVVGLEPSCTAVFRDELLGLFPEDPLARRLAKQTYMFSEFLAARGENTPLRTLDREALLHGHCNQKAVIGMTAERAVLERLGLRVDELEAGCCGMAGSFGYERHKYAVSVAAGERVLAPAVRRLHEDALVIANGFSCREQIAHLTGRRALHLAEVLETALAQD